MPGLYSRIPTIEVRNLRKRSGATQVLDGLSFAAPDDAITGLPGGNGAGKSTVLRTICGVLKTRLLDHSGT
ncbi:MAG TPA: ATP-binding cassette domain-containing protein [Bryobacteraceae bacterium]|nr:ATP-binding cassette domain-containing protein [Bryobacteraceae bacterium]